MHCSAPDQALDLNPCLKAPTPCPAVMAFVYKTFLGSPLKLFASIGHWALWHFDLNKYSEQQVRP